MEWNANAGEQDLSAGFKCPASPNPSTLIGALLKSSRRNYIIYARQEGIFCNTCDIIDKVLRTFNSP